MKKIIILCFLFASLTSFSQLITRSERIQHMQKMLNEQKKAFQKQSPSLFSIFQTSMTADEKQALEFLYAYMPLSDLLDYSGEFYLKNIQYSLKARSEMPWGKTIPEDEFLHFVLPIRVNNESLDTFRLANYNELSSRVKHLNMYQAALEVNHWCHEKVTYKGSDARTSSPLNTQKYSFGRCGEESVFTVAALRTVGIPARQVYTPRWAHSDDNHAWVEVWIDGKWHFLGACEPEPELNLGWFAHPASRTMLVHTRVFGKYFGNEEVITPRERFSELNLIQNYASTRHFYVKVVDSLNNPIKNAQVEYRLYNYSEFFPIAKTQTNTNGITEITLGLGDILIWANHQSAFGFKPITVAKADTVVIEIKHKVDLTTEWEITQIPPQGKTIAAVDENKANINRLKLKYEDSLRTCYMNTFFDSLQSQNFAKKYKYNESKISPLIVKSYGNHSEITHFLSKVPDSLKNNALNLLSIISEKDLRDVTAEILNDHLYHSQKLIWDEEFYSKYILNPRIFYENLTEWRKYFLQVFDKDFIKNAQENPNEIITWIKNEITIDSISNQMSRLAISPKSVHQYKVSDLRSRDILFVAICRSFGIPARLQPEMLTPQYYENNHWINVHFNTISTNNLDAKKDVLKEEIGKFQFVDLQPNIEKKYTHNFTLSLLKSGTLQLVEFPEEQKLSQFNSLGETLPVGVYALTTGNRLKEGSVWANFRFFEIKANSTSQLPIKISEPIEQKLEYPKPEFQFQKITDFNSRKNLVQSQYDIKNGILLVFIDPDKEPSKHIMNDLIPVKSELEQWNAPILFLLNPDKLSPTFNPSLFKNLPKHSLFVIDNQSSCIQSLILTTKKELSNDYPVICLLDKNGNIVFLSSGYRIGIGNEIMKWVNSTIK